MEKKIELLAPAGSLDALHAAVENGADAVYLGGKLFNARQQADNFDVAILKEALDYAHARGVSIYLTMNTLVSDTEMKQALMFAAEVREAGIDGIIVQDIGLARALHYAMPDVPLHGSTQMTVYDIEGVRALEAMGFKRAVLARELTLGEASEIAGCTRLEIEIFIHGALCVCYSGQCLMSSIIGGRSGNRGKCAQPCRLPYRLTAGGSTGQKPQYLLSPKDMCSLEHIPEIIGSGIRSLKIEGRMKSPEYVATVVRIYRKYLDIAIEGAREGRAAKLQVAGKDMQDLLQVFNRGGFSSGYLKGKTGRDMMSFDKPNNSGIYIGSVLEYNEKFRTVSTRLEGKLSIGDGVEIWSGGLNSPGGVVTSIARGRILGQGRAAAEEGKTGLKTAGKGDLVAIGSFKGKIMPGMGIYKTLDTELMKAARESFTGKNVKQVKIRGKALLKAGKPLTLKAEDNDGHIVSAVGEILPEIAFNKPLTEERLKEQLNRTGSTPFVFTELLVELEDGLSLPVSEINEVRRQALESLLRLRADRYAGLRGDGDTGKRIEEILERPYLAAVTVMPTNTTDILNMDLHGDGGTGKRNEEILGQPYPAAVTVMPSNTGASCEGAPEPGVPSGLPSVVNHRDPAVALHFYKWDKSVDYAGLGADRVYLPFGALNRPGFRDTMSALRETGAEVFGWLPTVTRGSFENLIDRFSDMYEAEKDSLDGILAGNIGTVNRLKGIKGLKLAGDISMNLFNAFSMQEAAAMGLESAALSIELTMQQIFAITKVNEQRKPSFFPLRIETVVYGRLPLMTSEYCPVGCVAGGLDASSRCSRCCGKGEYKLQDRMGAEFPVLCDHIDCRSTILNSNVLFVPDSLESLKSAGVDIFRLYIWDETPELVKDLVRLYKAAAAGSGKELPEYDGLTEGIRNAGFTKGHYYRGV